MLNANDWSELLDVYLWQSYLLFQAVFSVTQSLPSEANEWSCRVVLCHSNAFHHISAAVMNNRAATELSAFAMFSPVWDPGNVFIARTSSWSWNSGDNQKAVELKKLELLCKHVYVSEVTETATPFEMLVLIIFLILLYYFWVI